MIRILYSSLPKVSRMGGKSRKIGFEHGTQRDVLVLRNIKSRQHLLKPLPSLKTDDQTSPKTFTDP
jgi:hypothetical protein